MLSEKTTLSTVANSRNKQITATDKESLTPIKENDNEVDRTDIVVEEKVLRNDSQKQAMLSKSNLAENKPSPPKSAVNGQLKVDAGSAIEEGKNNRKKRKAASAASISGDLGNRSEKPCDDGEDFEFSAPPRSKHKKKDNNIDMGVDLGICGDPTSPIFKNSCEAESENRFVVEGGWCVSNSRQQTSQEISMLSKMRMTNEKFKSVENVSGGPLSPSMDDEEVIAYPQAISVEVQLSLREKRESEAAASVPQRKGDKKCFTKNHVRGLYDAKHDRNCHVLPRRPQLIVSLSQMERLLPKESEREVQVNN